MSAPQDNTAIKTEVAPGEWTTYGQAKEAIDFMTLAELETWTGRKAPELLPYSGLALGIGVVLLAIGIRATPILFLGLLVGVYGLVAIASNRNRAGLYKEDIYRRWVQDRAANSDEGETLP
jgi:hypothetical protein